MKKIAFICNGREASLMDEHLSAKTAQAIKEAFSFSSPGARWSPQYKRWLQEKALNVPEALRTGWNGKISMMRYSKIPVGLLLGAKKDLVSAGFEVEIKKWKNKPEVKLKKGFIEKDRKYSFQNECVMAMLDSLKVGGGLVLSATASGKTKIAAQFFSNIKGKCLFVVDQVPLLYQTQEEIQLWLKESVGVIGNGKFEPCRITVATIQTLQKYRGRIDLKKFLKGIQVTLIDEIHVQLGRRNFDVLNISKPKAVIGLTATLQLRKKMVRFKCSAICGPLIYSFPMSEGVERGVLSQGVVVQIPVTMNDKPRELVERKDGYTIKKVPVDDYTHHVVNNANLTETIYWLVKECIAQDLCVAVLVDRIKHIKDVKKRLSERFNPRMFYGAISTDKRKKSIAKFEDGDANLILANRVFTKGINVKRIDVVIDGAQKSSKNDAGQKYGRAVRLHAEKAGIYYFDLKTTGVPTLERAAKNRKSAFKQAKIPFRELTMVECAFGSKGMLRIADKMLTEALKK